MTKKSKLLLALVAAVVILLNFGIWQIRPETARMTITVTAEADTTGTVQLFYGPEEGSYDASKSSSAGYPTAGVRQEMTFPVDADTRSIRIDTGDQEGTWQIFKITGSYGTASDTVRIDPAEIFEQNKIDSITKDGDTLVVRAQAGDPYFACSVSMPSAAKASQDAAQQKNLILKILATAILDLMLAAFLLFRKKLTQLPIELIQNRALIYSLAKNDFKTRYAGSYLGIVWAFIQPVVTVLVYWFVFSVGFRSSTMDKVPFVLYLIAGICPWFYCQDVLNSGTNALIEYSYLVKKVVFKISILPMVKAISAFFVHAFFLAVVLVIYTLYGIHPTFYTLQLFYYFFCMFVFLLGLCYATSAIVIFFRDLTQIINILLQVGVWTIPIMWDINIIPERLRWIFAINPMYYIVNGYRDSLYNTTWFWNHLGNTVYFWGVTLVIFLLGTVIFKRLKPHFADVL